MKNLFALALLGFMLAPKAQAYIIAVPENQGAINYSEPTRLLFAGRGTDLGIQPQNAALSAAKLYHLNFPNDQLVLIGVIETLDEAAHKTDQGATDREFLRKAGWRLLHDNDEKLETKSATAEIMKFQHVRSLEFWGHNSATLGVQADGSGFRFDFEDPIVNQIASIFDAGAFASVHGCNGGWVIAQRMAKIWNIPFSGAFTETQFERLHSDGHFYVDDPKEAPSTDWAPGNPDVDANDCSAGGCLRMRPDDRRYIGIWGDFAGPFLGHYKFFCPLSQKECERRMALSLYGFIAEKSLKADSTAADFKHVAEEYLCPVSIDRKLTTDCMKQLDLIAQGKGDRTVSFEQATKYEADPQHPQLSCTLQSCQAKITCDDKTCHFSDRVSKGSTTLTDEFLHLLNGFKTLRAEGGL